MRVHNPPFPTREAHESAGSPEPRMIVAGDFKNMDYSFIEADGRDNRRIARVDRSFGEGLSVGPDNFSVQVASAVDVALIVLCSIVIDASINDGADMENGMVRFCPVGHGFWAWCMPWDGGVWPKWRGHGW